MQGTRIGAFTVQERIGSGAISEVYAAIETETGRRVALKLLARALAFNAYARADLLREIEQLVKLRHPQIVPIMQTGMYREQAYLVLPYYAAGSLEKRMDRPWTLAEARSLIAQLAAPLDVAHAGMVVHGHLKPGNILFDEKDRPCVSDFGLMQLALANSAGWRDNAVTITPYSAPEQRAGNAYDGRADIYALGVLVQQLTGRNDVAKAARMENSAERPPTVAALAETLIDEPKPKWRERIFFRLANQRR
jgi:serine/threonine-protein kinase PpkA